MHCRHGGVLICPSLRPDPLGIGHEVRLIPVQHVKPFVQRHKNDSIDAAAIVMAVMHPSTQFVAVKMQDQQAQAMLFRTRELSVTQRVPLTNALPSADRDGTNDAMDRIYLRTSEQLQGREREAAEVERERLERVPERDIGRGLRLLSGREAASRDDALEGQ